MAVVPVAVVLAAEVGWRQEASAEQRPLAVRKDVRDLKFLAFVLRK